MQRLAQSKVAHLATVGDDGRPHIVPFVFAIDSDTLYFAGEATDTEGEAGTVAGALQSGLRAARELLQGDSR